MESLRKAENEINAKINHERYVSLDEFYELVGLKGTTNSASFGLGLLIDLWRWIFPPLYLSTANHVWLSITTTSSRCDGRRNYMF